MSPAVVPTRKRVKEPVTDGTFRRRSLRKAYVSSTKRRVPNEGNGMLSGAPSFRSVHLTRGRSRITQRRFDHLFPSLFLGVSQHFHACQTVSLFSDTGLVNIANKDKYSNRCTSSSRYLMIFPKVEPTIGYCISCQVRYWSAGVRVLVDF